MAWKANYCVFTLSLEGHRHANNITYTIHTNESTDHDWYRFVCLRLCKEGSPKHDEKHLLWSHLYRSTFFLRKKIC